MRYTIEDHFEDDDGVRRHVKEFVVTKGEPPADFPKFVGVDVIEVQLGPQIMPRQFSADLNAETLDEAFENFNKVMPKASEAAKKQIEQEMEQRREQQQRQMQQKESRIVLPGSG